MGQPASVSTEMELDLLAPDFLQNPYPHYRLMREAGPVHPNPAGGWLLTRYRDVRDALGNPALKKVEHLGCFTDKNLTDTPEGTEADVRMRDVTKAALSPGRMRQIAGRTRALADRLVDEIVERGKADLIPALCDPVANIVFCEIFGVPAADRDVFGTWGESIIDGLDVVVRKEAPGEEHRDDAIMQFAGYLRELIAEKRRRPADDLLSALAAAVPGGREDLDNQLLFHCAYLLPAGQAPTAAFLGNALLALMRNPAQYALLGEELGKGDKRFAERAIDELVRYDPPAHITVRAAAYDMEMSGQPIRADEMVISLIGAANRDPDVFAESDRLDLRRDPNPHTAFGFGPHYCLGAPLGRMEGAAVLSALTKRIPRLTLAGQATYKPTFARRGVAKLPVRTS